MFILRMSTDLAVLSILVSQTLAKYLGYLSLQVYRRGMVTVLKCFTTYSR